MNYIAEINSFYNWVTFKSIPADAQALWHTLMQMNNRCSVCIDGKYYWRTEFSIPNGTLASMLAFSIPQLERMRNRLIQAGRIVYKKGRGSQSGTYKIIPFDESLFESNINNEKVWIVQHNVAQSVVQTVVQTDSNPLRKTDTDSDLCNIMCTQINRDKSNNKYIYNYSQHPISSNQSLKRYDRDEIDTMIKHNIDFDILRTEYTGGELENLVELIVEVICSIAPTIKIGGSDTPREHVRERFFRLDIEHIRYVLDSFSKNSTKVRNIKAYLITSLYNAPATMSSYYTAAVNHDMNGGGMNG